ncbi:MAG: LysR family transcriptional regulator [Alphaproteobacteria bacterium]|nr:LysR family transcriptional regulator [Alphaproteobacteria bacterium]
MDWDKLRTFHIVAEAGSFTHAGDALGLSQSAVSRQISSLEESLEIKLFHRHARGLALTEAGELLSNTAKDIFSKLEMVEGRLLDSRSLPSGSLRITLPEFIGSTWLAPKLAELHDKYPDLQITLLIDDRIYNLGMREADAALRLYKPEQHDLIYTSLGKIHFKICGSKSYFTNHQAPETIQELENHNLIGYPENITAPYEDPNWLLRKAGISAQANSKLMHVNSIYAIYEAVRHGAGIAALPEYMIKDDKNIVTCLDSVPCPALDVYFVYAEERKHSKRIGLLQEFLSQHVENKRF